MKEKPTQYKKVKIGTNWRSTQNRIELDRIMFNQVYSWIFLSKKSSTGHLSSRCRIIIARKSDFQCYGLCFWIYENTNFIRIDICQVAVLGWRVRLGCKPFRQTKIWCWDFDLIGTSFYVISTGNSRQSLPKVS